MITKEQQLRIDNLFKQIDNLESSDSSTMTPISVCRDLISQKFNVNFSYLDICCGKGTLLLCLYLEFWNFLENIITDIEERNKFIHSKIAGNDISKAQVDIAKSTMIKVQKILKIKNLLDFNIYNYNILDEKNNLDELKKKFTCVITNPPYNSERGDNNQSVDIYPDFVNKAFELADRYVIMITKSNWMNFPSHKKFREKMINGYNVDKIVHYSENPFKGTDIQGGVSYFIIDNENTKETFELNGVVYDRKTALHFLPYELNEKELKLLDKIMSFDKIDMSNYRSKGYYDIKSNDVRLIKEKKDGYVYCHVSELKGKDMYFPISEFNDKIKNDYNKYKVFTTSSYGVPNLLGRVLTGRNELNSESLVNWVFNTENEMINWFNYVNSKLFRVCVSMIKNKKDVSKITFSLIPHIDFSKLEKVDDENIYKYLNLTEEDIQTIEERCERLKLIKK
jgi:SAM-dependent methyltransferase